METADIYTQLEQVTDDFRAAVTCQQQDGDPAHEDFYTWGWALSDLTMRLQDAGRVLSRQIAAYGERRVLRDDEEGSDPHARLLEACAHLDEMAAALGSANNSARLYHSAVGHIGVEVNP
jgi:hypothetical protein